MSDNMQPTDEVLDDEVLDEVEDTESLDEVEEFDPFEGMSDEELDALCDEDDVSGLWRCGARFSQRLCGPGSVVPTPVSPRCSTPAMAKRSPLPLRWPRRLAAACALWLTAPAISWSLSIPRVFISPRTVWAPSSTKAPCSSSTTLTSSRF